MVDKTEKERLVKKLITVQKSEECDVRKHYEALNKLILADTFNGKLYKYRSFDSKGRALDNLKNQTLYCAEPNTFNDPFDCHIGMDYQSLVEALLGDAFNRIENVLHGVCDVLNKEDDLSSYKENEQLLIKKMLEGNVGEFYKKYKETPTLKFCIRDNISVLVDIMNLVLDNAEHGNSFRNVTEAIPGYIENLRSEGIEILADENMTFSDFAKANGITGDFDEIDLVSKLYRMCNPNDENNAEKEAEKWITGIGERIISKMLSLVRVGCLCTDYKNRLMWSHYADSHKGFCVEYDFMNRQNTIDIFPVIYSKERPKIPWKPFVNNDDKTMDQAIQELLMVFLTKDEVWEYENEWRIFIPAQTGPNIHFAPISCIYVGAACSEENKKKIVQIAQQIKVPVKQMVVDRGEYELRSKNVEL